MDPVVEDLFSDFSTDVFVVVEDEVLDVVVTLMTGSEILVVGLMLAPTEELLLLLLMPELMAETAAAAAAAAAAALGGLVGKRDMGDGRRA